MERLSERFAARALLLIITLTLLFHALIISGVIPYTIVWGGRIASESQMRMMEAISVVINVLMLSVVAVRAGVLRVVVHPVLLKVALWLMTGLFLLNTLGNLLSKSVVEKLIFTPVTLVLALLCVRLALGNPANWRELATRDQA